MPEEGLASARILICARAHLAFLSDRPFAPIYTSDVLSQAA